MRHREGWFERKRRDDERAKRHEFIEQPNSPETKAAKMLVFAILVGLFTVAVIVVSTGAVK